MGGIIFWAIVRTALLIPALWVMQNYMEYKYWWWFGLMAIYGIIVHPAMIQYRLFKEESKEVVNNTLCSSCKHFNETAVICLLHDKHPTVDYLPCDGLEWEPKGGSYEQKEIDS